MLVTRRKSGESVVIEYTPTGEQIALFIDVLESGKVALKVTKTDHFRVVLPEKENGCEREAACCKPL